MAASPQAKAAAIGMSSGPGNQKTSRSVSWRGAMSSGLSSDVSFLSRIYRRQSGSRDTCALSRGPRDRLRMAGWCTGPGAVPQLPAGASTTLRLVAHAINSNEGVLRLLTRAGGSA